jgi:hypothetical protein
MGAPLGVDGWSRLLLVETRGPQAGSHGSGRPVHLEFRREITVPLSAIESVTENRWVNIHPVTVHFRVPTEFGDKITFMPVQHVFLFWRSHPVVQELRSAAKMRELMSYPREP